MEKFSILIGCLMLTHYVKSDSVYAQREFTVRIEPGVIECFYEKAQKSQIIDFEYQVIDGGHGNETKLIKKIAKIAHELSDII